MAVYNIITLDHSTAGVPEDGFGVDDNGNFFVAISKMGFIKNKDSLIFLFVNDKIVVTYAKIKKSRTYKADKFRSIKRQAKDSYDIMVLERIVEYHLMFLGRSKRRKNLEVYLSRVHVNRIISNILSRIYKHVGAYYDKSSVNLKRHKYQDFYLRVKDAGFMWKIKDKKFLNFLSFLFNYTLVVLSQSFSTSASCTQSSPWFCWVHALYFIYIFIF